MPDISRTSAAALAGLAPADAGTLLESLVKEHLLTKITRDRYRFHNLLRAFAATKALADERPG